MTISVSGNNGTAPGSALSTLPGANGDGSAHTAPHVTADSYARIRQAMVDAGLGDLVPSDGWSCYRDRAAQQHMRDIGLTTIPVGQSIHGEWTYGSAVDFSGLGGFGAPRHEWLRANGAGFGWYQPGWAASGGSLPEPWHWEYDSRSDPHNGEEPEDMSFTDADRNMLANTNALLQETPYRSAQQVMAWQISRVEGAPTSFLQDQTDGVSNTYTLVASESVGGSRGFDGWQAAVALIIALAILVGLVATLLDTQTTGVGAGVGTLVGGLIGWLASIRTGRREHHAHPVHVPTSTTAGGDV